jgi:hypothetical protein
MNLYETEKDYSSLEMVEKTLIKMYQGGIYDHIGGGFSRYSTDEKWLVPHFEKMLYDNALLITAYLEAYQATADVLYLQTAEETATYLIRELKADNGGFYTAEDADSEGEEGKFYLFSKSEIETILKEDSNWFLDYLNITEKGNIEGLNIPNLLESSEIIIDRDKFEVARQKVFSYRNERVKPFRDEKILTRYNGLVLSAFARLSRVTKKDKYFQISKRIVSFLFDNLYHNNILFSRYKDGEIKYIGYDEDYAYLIMGLIDLYQASFIEDYLKMAKKLQEEFLEKYYNFDNGGFFQISHDSETVIIKRKEFYDGATPSGNSVAVANLLRLSVLLDNVKYEELGRGCLESFGSEINSRPLVCINFITSVLALEKGYIKIEVCGRKKEDVRGFIDVAEKMNLPFYVIIYSEDEKRLKDGKPTAYICLGRICLEPVNKISDFKKILGSV